MERGEAGVDSVRSLRDARVEVWGKGEEGREKTSRLNLGRERRRGEGIADGKREKESGQACGSHPRPHRCWVSDITSAVPEQR